MKKYEYKKIEEGLFEIIHQESQEHIANATTAEKADFLTQAANQFSEEGELREAYEWWEYYISKDENNRLLKKYYPDEPTVGGPRFFMDTDKLRIYRLEKAEEGK